LRGQDDPNLVIVEETYDSREVAQAALNHPELPTEIEKAGVDMTSIRIDYLDEVASGTH
jgi:quinol monooxygenase YgiN